MRAFTGIAVAICLSLWLLQGYIIGLGEAGYLNDRSLMLGEVIHNLGAYAQIVGAFWLGSSRYILSFTLLGIVAVLTGIGAYARWNVGLTVVEFLLLPYLIVVVMWPSPLPGLRFMFPHIPLCVFLALLGLQRRTARLPRSYRMCALSVLLVLIAAGYTTTYLHTNFGPIPAMDGSSTFNELCRTIRESTSLQATLITSRPRRRGCIARAVHHHSSAPETWTCGTTWSTSTQHTS